MVDFVDRSSVLIILFSLKPTIKNGRQCRHFPFFSHHFFNFLPNLCHLSVQGLPKNCSQKILRQLRQLVTPPGMISRKRKWSFLIPAELALKKGNFQSFLSWSLLRLGYQETYFCVRKQPALEILRLNPTILSPLPFIVDICNIYQLFCLIMRFIHSSLIFDDHLSMVKDVEMLQ